VDRPRDLGLPRPPIGGVLRTDEVVTRGPACEPGGRARRRVGRANRRSDRRCRGHRGGWAYCVFMPTKRCPRCGKGIANSTWPR